jgi:hypothetical protein
VALYLSDFNKKPKTEAKEDENEIEGIAAAKKTTLIRTSFNVTQEPISR